VQRKRKKKAHQKKKKIKAERCLEKSRTKKKEREKKKNHSSFEYVLRVQSCALIGIKSLVWSVACLS
jgi:hypothetical protein